jgi:DNA replication protein DnaD
MIRNNKRKLSYISGILKNWENESLLTVEEIDAYQENGKTVQNHKQSTKSNSIGRDIPTGFVLDLTAGKIGEYSGKGFFREFDEGGVLAKGYGDST